MRKILLTLLFISCRVLADTEQVITPTIPTPAPTQQSGQCIPQTIEIVQADGSTTYQEQIVCH